MSIWRKAQERARAMWPLIVKTNLRDALMPKEIPPRPTPRAAADYHRLGFNTGVVTEHKQHGGPYIGQTLYKVYVEGKGRHLSQMAMVRKGEGGYFATVVKIGAKTIYEEIPS